MLGLRSVAGMSILKAYVSPWCSTEGSAHAGTGTDPCSKPTRHPAICRKRRPRDDLEQLDPKVPEHVRAEVESADPDLDQDMRDWFAPDCDRPRLTLLGPVAVRAHGAPIAKRKPFFIEVLAYLALREHGATAEEVATAFGHNLSTTRSSVKTVRDWLGVNPRTGEPHLPEATRSRAAALRGIPVYPVDDLLVA